MTRRIQSAALLSAALISLGGVTAMAAGSSAPVSQGGLDAAAADKVVFTVGIGNNVDSFNPFLGIEAESYEMWALMYDYMITYSSKDMSPQPGLAESWETSGDGLTWTFHIRSGVNWSDDVPLTAHDIAFTYNRILDGGPESTSWLSYLGSVKEITAPDDATVVLKLSKPNAVLPLLPIPIVPEHIWKDISEKEVKTYSNEPPGVVGSGPFRIVEGKVSGSVYRFEPNPDYWQGTPKIDELVFRVFNAEDTLVQALKKGEIDFAEDITPLQIKSLEGEDGITAQMGSSPGFEEIAFNVGSVDLKTGEPMGDPNPAVLDPKFRFALNFAIDREAIAERVYQGGADPATTIIPAAYTQYQWQAPDEGAFDYDPDRAAELLDEAGYTMGPDGRRQMPDGSAMEPLRLYARSESPTSLGTMNFFKEWLDDLGIDSKVSNFESGKLTNIILDGTFDAFEWGWYVEPDPDSMLSYFTCAQRGGWSDSWYCNKDYDRLYAAQHAELDQATREDQVKQMQEMLYEDAPYLVTVYDRIGEAYRSDRFHGFVPQPEDGGILLFQYGIANYINLEPGPATDGSAAGGTDGSATVSDSADSGDGDDGGMSGATVALVVGVLVVGVAALLGGWTFYRRATADQRE